MRFEHSILYKDARFFSSFPSITRLSDDTLLLVFRRARDVRWLVPSEEPGLAADLRSSVDHLDSRSQLVSLRLDAQGQLTTSLEMLPIDPEASDQDASLLTLRNGNVLLSSFRWYPLPPVLEPVVKDWYSRVGDPNKRGQYLFWGGFSRLFLTQSNKWRDSDYLPPLLAYPDIVPGKRGFLGGGVRGQAVEWLDEILLPTYQRGSYLFVSSDGGLTWSFRSIIAEDGDNKLELNEPSLCVLENNTLMAFMRSERGSDRLVTAASFDGGRSWQPWMEREIIGHPFHPLKLSDGRIWLCYGYRHPPYGIRAKILDPMCENLDDAPEIIVRDDAAFADIGYPWSVQLVDGTVYVVYYFTSGDGVRHIARTRVYL